MQPRELVAAVARRWAVLLLAAALGGAVGLATAATAPVGYRASTLLYVGMPQVAATSGLGNSSLVARELLPSLLEAARTAAVLQPVLDDVGLPATPGELAASLELTVVEDTSLVVVAARAADPGQAAAVARGVGEQLQRLAAEQYTRADGSPSLQVVTVTPAVAPRSPAGQPASRLTVLGAVLAAATAALTVGLREASRPRVRTADDVAAVTDAPVIAEVDRPAVLARTADSGLRSASTERLRWLLSLAPGVPDGARLGLLGGRSTVDLARDLTATARGPAAVTVAGVSAEQVTDPGTVADLDGLVVVVDTRRTTRQELSRLVAAARSSTLPLLGVVLDGVLSPAADRPTRWVARLRGDVGLPQRDARAPGGQPVLATSTRLTAVVAVLALGLDLRLPVETDTALLAAAVLLPVWIGTFTRYRGTGWLTVGAGLALVCGALLALYHSVDHDFAPRQALSTGLALLGAVGTIGVLLWARSVWSLPVVGVTYGVGALVSGLLDAQASVNPFKFELSFPLTVIVLSLLAGRVRPLLSVTALGVLGVLLIAHDARSAFGFCLIAAVLVLWQARPTRAAGRPRALRTALLVGLALLGTYSAVSELLVSGALGAEVQARSVAQVEQSGTLLLGGRPEWTATWALMQQDPLGFGLGTVPAAADVALAKEGFAVTNVPTAEGYIENYLFAGRFELHSVIADLWSNAGPVGLAWGLLLAGLLVAALVDRLSRRTASALACVLVLKSLWWLAFGPLPANLPDIAMAVGLVLPLRAALRPIGAAATGGRTGADGHPDPDDRPAVGVPVSAGR